MAETTLPLGGRAYNRLVGRLSAEARRTYDLLLDSYYKTAPTKWRDVLTSTQEKRLSIVTDPDEWRVARKALSRGLSEVPVLGVGALSPDHVYVADHRAHTAILDLSNVGSGGLPEDLKTWLADRDIVKLTSNGRDEPLDLEVDLAINTSDVYRSVAMSGRWSILDRARSFGVESQSAWAVGYHHRRCEESEWKALLGNHK